MLEKGSTVFSQNMYDKKLAAALNEGAEVAVKLLLQRLSMKTSRGEMDETGKTYGNALQFAASRGDGAKIKELLDQGADINDVSGNHGSALQAAALRGNIVIVQLSMLQVTIMEVHCMQQHILETRTQYNCY
ncbi:Ankyrin repeat-containing domain [Lasallia pustulata]|uniref:Ankyrin repeat-containing domain n=1 Tax=Lasallia pustulata TaxID=136370 RepID=A0A1W5D526_9LECA|nr:Ankyrin repeat-containing domain [Lasallia pustulata]